MLKRFKRLRSMPLLWIVTTRGAWNKAPPSFFRHRDVETRGAGVDFRVNFPPRGVENLRGRVRPSAPVLVQGASKLEKSQQKRGCGEMAGRKVLRPCLGTKGKPCGRPCYKPRCPACLRDYERDYKKTARPEYDYRERKRREQVVKEYRERYGEVCFGWRRRPHPTGPTNPLTADHVIPVAAGGRESGDLGVLCLSCNSAKGASRL